MNEEDARWQAILDAQAEIVSQPVPLHPAREGRANRRPTRKSEQFNEALSELGSWSTLDQPHRRMSA
jgi:hypothetical protein